MSEEQPAEQVVPTPQAGDCQNCAYSRPARHGGPVLECHAYPPTPQGQRGQWPEVDPGDWCGIFVAK